MKILNVFANTLLLAIAHLTLVFLKSSCTSHAGQKISHLEYQWYHYNHNACKALRKRKGNLVLNWIFNYHAGANILCLNNNKYHRLPKSACWNFYPRAWRSGMHRVYSVYSVDSMHARAPRARVKISTRTFGQPMQRLISKGLLMMYHMCMISSTL